MSAPRLSRRITPCAVACAAAALLAAAPLRAQGAGAVLLVLDEDGIDSGRAPNFFSPDDVNAGIAQIGLRDPLKYFVSNVGGRVMLPSGQNGDAGWFAVKSVPASWSAVDPTLDGIQNYLLAAPGLGSPDAGGSRESLLANVPDVAPLTAAGLELLVGRQACAVVYDGDVAGSSLTGGTHGVVAFRVVSIGGGSAFQPDVEVEILDASQVCGGALVPFAEAP